MPYASIERQRAYDRKRYAENPEKRQNTVRRWRAANPDRLSEYERSRRGRKREYNASRLLILNADGTYFKQRTERERLSRPTEAVYWAGLRRALISRFGSDVRAAKIHMTAFGEVGVSDVLLCLRGRYVALELKRRWSKPTEKQLRFLDDIQQAGGIARVVYTDEPVEDVVRWIAAEIEWREEDGPLHA